MINKKIIIFLSSVSAVLAGVAVLSAFEAHIINVTADITNGLKINLEEIPFGKVVPQEYLERDFEISLSQGFLSESRLVGVTYDIVQKPKPKGNRNAVIKICNFPGGFDFKEYVVYAYCRDYSPENSGYLYDEDFEVCTTTPLNYHDYCYYNLCPFLSKLDGDSEDRNDTSAPSYFQGNHCINPGEASGKLEKPGDIKDKWVIDLKVPPVTGKAAQDWPLDCPTIPAEARYGCDLWIEVTSIITTEGEEVICQTNADCDDKNICTNDSCSNGSCIFVPNTNPCDDGNACTIGDTCSNGMCVGTPKVCNDQNACTNDSCNPATGCIYTFAPAGSPCDDGMFCNGIDSCNGNGVCANHTGDPCGSVSDSDCMACNELTDSCTAYEPAGSPCNDGLFCNGVDSCNSNGVCANHTGDPCPGPDGDTNCAESCNETADNCTANDPNGSPCNGPGWYCSSGLCIQP